MKTNAELTVFFREQLRNNGYLHPEPYEWHNGEPLYYGEPRKWTEGEAIAASLTLAFDLFNRPPERLPFPTWKSRSTGETYYIKAKQ